MSENGGGGHKHPKAHPMDQRWTVEIDAHSAMLVEYALARRLIQVSHELEILKRTRIRELMPIERWELPSNLQRMTREQLQEQIDPWITLEDSLNHWMKQFVRPDLREQDA